MPDTVARFTVSVPPELLAQFDDVSAGKGYLSRSEAVRDALRDYLVAHTWQAEGTESDEAEVIGTLTLLCDADGPRPSDHLRRQQGKGRPTVISVMQATVDSKTLLEVAVLRGTRAAVASLADEVISLRNVKHGRLVAAAADGALP